MVRELIYIVIFKLGVGPNYIIEIESTGTKNMSFLRLRALFSGQKRAV